MSFGSTISPANKTMDNIELMQFNNLLNQLNEANEKVYKLQKKFKNIENENKELKDSIMNNTTSVNNNVTLESNSVFNSNNNVKNNTIAGFSNDDLVNCNNVIIDEVSYNSLVKNIKHLFKLTKINDKNINVIDNICGLLGFSPNTKSKYIPVEHMKKEKKSFLDIFKKKKWVFIIRIILIN